MDDITLEISSLESSNPGTMIHTKIPWGSRGGAPQLDSIRRILIKDGGLENLVELVVSILYSNTLSPKGNEIFNSALMPARAWTILETRMAPILQRTLYSPADL